jgi:glucans biosynthesis protein C
MSATVQDVGAGANRWRLDGIDNLKWTMIVLVVLMHLNVTYSGNGLWYFTERTPYGPLAGTVFGMYGSMTQAYFMGLLFFVSGLFVPGSLLRKGTARFLRDRLVRLGVPLAVWVALLHPLTVWIGEAAMGGTPAPAAWYVHYVLSLDFLFCFGPLWFVAALFVFSAVFAAWRSVYPNRSTGSAQPVTHRTLARLALTITVLAFLIRLVQPGGLPLGRPLLGNFLQLGFFASYAVLFAAGTWVRENGGLDLLPRAVAMRWFRWTLAAGIPLWFLGIPLGFAMAGATGQPPDIGAYFGGLRWQAAQYAVWESFFCVGVSAGLIVLFRDRFNARTPLTAFLSDNAFAVYVLHPPVIVAIAGAVHGWEAPPLAKMLAVASFAIPLCFVLAAGLRRVPVIARYFS